MAMSKLSHPVKAGTYITYSEIAPAAQVVKRISSDCGVVNYAVKINNGSGIMKSAILRIKPRSAEDFNERRSDKSRGWRCVARYHHLGTWTNLIKHLGIPKYSDTPPERIPSKVKVIVHNDYDFRD